jgi:hypothetical protein
MRSSRFRTFRASVSSEAARVAATVATIPPPDAAMPE